MPKAYQPLAPGREAHPGERSAKTTIDPEGVVAQTAATPPGSTNRGIARIPAVVAPLDRRLMAAIPPGLVLDTEESRRWSLRSNPRLMAEIPPGLGPYAEGISAISPGSRSAPGEKSRRNRDRPRRGRSSDRCDPFGVDESWRRSSPGGGRFARPPAKACNPSGIGSICRRHISH